MTTESPMTIESSMTTESPMTIESSMTTESPKKTGFFTPFFVGSCNRIYKERFGETKICKIDISYLSPTGNTRFVDNCICLEYSVNPNIRIQLYDRYNASGYVLPYDIRTMELSKKNGYTFALFPDNHPFVTSQYRTFFDVTIVNN